MSQKYKEPLRFWVLFTSSFSDCSSEWYWQTDRHQNRCGGLWQRWETNQYHWRSSQGSFHWRVPTQIFRWRVFVLLEKVTRKSGWQRVSVSCYPFPFEIREKGFGRADKICTLPSWVFQSIKSMPLAITPLGEIRLVWFLLRHGCLMRWCWRLPSKTQWPRRPFLLSKEPALRCVGLPPMSKSICADMPP